MYCFLFDILKDIFKSDSFFEIHDKHFLYNLAEQVGVFTLQLANGRDVSIKIKDFSFRIKVVNRGKVTYF